MRQESLRWGGVMGLAGAILGVLALVIGRIIAPVRSYTTAESAVFSIFVQGMLVLVLLGVVLGLAYYAGLRAERDRQLVDAPATQVAAADSADSAGRLGSALAGALVMLCYWLATTFYSYTVPLNRVQRPGPVLETLEGHIILLIVFLVLGAALGALGGRAPAARNLLDRLLVTPPPAVSSVAAPAQPSTTPTQPSAAESPTE